MITAAEQNWMLNVAKVVEKWNEKKIGTSHSGTRVPVHRVQLDD
jgi:hypothetical protein